MNLGFTGEVHHIDLEVGGICRVRAGSIDELLIVPRKPQQSFTLKMAIVTFVETSGNFYSPVRPIPRPLIALNASHESFKIIINSCNLCSVQCFSYCNKSINRVQNCPPNKSLGVDFTATDTRV
jgi:hypothetical protein